MEFFRGDITPEPYLKLTKELLVSSRIPRSLWRCEVSKIPDRLAYKKAVADYLANLPWLDRGGRGLYFHGPYRRGKSGSRPD